MPERNASPTICGKESEQTLRKVFYQRLVTGVSNFAK